MKKGRVPKLPKLPDAPVKAVPLVAGAATTQSASTEPATIFERIKSFFTSLQTDGISKKIGGTNGALRTGMWFGAGFAAGYLFKKYFQAFMITLIASLLVLKGLEYSGVVTIHWAALKQLVGFRAEAGWQDSIQGLIDVTRGNIFVFVAVGSGFLIGHYLG